jgi:endo-1,4-beta-xylanase
MNRRDFLTALGAMTIAEWVSLEAEAQIAASPLKRLADQKGLMFGSCLALKYFGKSPAYEQLFVSQCDIATPELHMKWDSLSRQPGEYDFNNADEFVTFCASKRIKAGVARFDSCMGEGQA